jgi:hypothetical protein
MVRLCFALRAYKPKSGGNGLGVDGCGLMIGCLGKCTSGACGGLKTLGLEYFIVIVIYI